MADEEASDENGRVERLISWAASVVAPLSVLTAVLFYFGYASSRAQYAYFGLDVDTIGLSTQDFVMRSPQPLLTPLVMGVGAALTLYAGRVRGMLRPEERPRLGFVAATSLVLVADVFWAT